MKAYYIAQITVRDPDLYKEVQARFSGVFEKFAGRVVAADPRYEVLAGKSEAGRVVILEFPSEDELKRWYYSPEYQETVKLRERAADVTILLVHGLA